MPRIPTFPTLYDDCKKISITDLKSWGYLKPGQYESGIIKWSFGGHQTGRIRILVNTVHEDPYLELDYQSNDKPINYRVNLVSIPSNLGKGEVLYFQCPQTGKFCRKLYLVDSYFFHREAFSGCYYQKQVYSHDTRKMIRQYENAFALDQYWEEANQPYFKTHYRGKPTRRYEKLLDLERSMAGRVS